MTTRQSTLDRLSAANPVPERNVAAVVPATWREGLLAQIVSEPVESGSPRPRPRSRRRLATIAVAAALAGAVGAPAFGLGRTIVDFFAAERASDNVRLRFAEMDAAAPGDGSGVIASEARRVYVFRTASGEHVLSLAPTDNESFCWSITGLASGCQTILSARGPFQPGEHEPVRMGLVFTDIPAPTMPQSPVLIGGNVRANDSSRLKIEFQDGKNELIPFVWISAPIDAGFFLYELPRERWAPGKRPVALSLYAADGALLSRTTFSVSSTIEEYEANSAER
jgi:hypothetical protein